MRERTRELREREKNERERETPKKYFSFIPHHLTLQNNIINSKLVSKKERRAVHHP